MSEAEKPAPVEGEVVETAPAVDESLRIIQSRDHPHYGEAGWLVPDTVQPATGQSYFKLSNCQHGTAGCYVLPEDITKAEATLETQENQTKPTEFDPYKYSQTVVDLLTTAFGKSYSVLEACQFAGIHKDTYYKWLKEIPEFEEAMALAKSQPLTKAKEVINNALTSGDIGTAKWLLERKDPEFKPKAEIDNNIGIKETRDKIAEFLDDDDSTDAISEQPAATPTDTSTTEVAEAPTDIS